MILSELVSNAVRHAASDVRVEAGATETDGLRLAVIDRSSRPIRRREADLLAESGRGLMLVDLLATRWGVEADRNGKQVWAELQ